VRVGGGAVAEIKAGIQAQQKFIGELLEHSSRWELDGMELRIYFPAEKGTFAGLIEGGTRWRKSVTFGQGTRASGARLC